MTAVHWFERTLASRAESLTNDLTRQRGLPSACEGPNSETSPSGNFERCKRETLFHSRFTCGMLSTLREWTCSAESEKRSGRKRCMPWLMTEQT